jgi:hypothetical protein
VSIDEGVALALDEARDAIDQQKGDLASIRNRAAALIGVGGLAASFFAGLANRDHPDVNAWLWVAVVAFAALAGFCVLVLIPRTITFQIAASEVVGWADEGDDPTKIARNLALHRDDSRSENQKVLDRLTWLYIGGVVALFVEIAALALNLGSH